MFLHVPEPFIIKHIITVLIWKQSLTNDYFIQNLVIHTTYNIAHMQNKILITQPTPNDNNFSKQDKQVIINV